MTLSYFEIAACVIAAGVGAWFFIGALRLRRAILTREAYVVQYLSLCDDDRIPLHLLESMQSIFKISCGVCASFYLMTMFALHPNGRPDATTMAEIRALPMESAGNAAKTIRSLFSHVSYAAPVIGFLMRIIVFRSSKPKDNGPDSEAVWASAADRFAHSF